MSEPRRCPRCRRAWLRRPRVSGLVPSAAQERGHRPRLAGRHRRRGATPVHGHRAGDDVFGRIYTLDHPEVAPWSRSPGCSTRRSPPSHAVDPDYPTGVLGQSQPAPRRVDHVNTTLAAAGWQVDLGSTETAVRRGAGRGRAWHLRHTARRWMAMAPCAASSPPTPRSSPTLCPAQRGVGLPGPPRRSRVAAGPGRATRRPLSRALPHHARPRSRPRPAPTTGSTRSLPRPPTRCVPSWTGSGRCTAVP